MAKKIKKRRVRGGQETGGRRGLRLLTSSDMQALQDALWEIISLFFDEVQRTHMSGGYDHLGIVLDEMVLDWDLMPAEHIDHVFIPLSLLGTTWSSWAEFGALKQKVRGLFKEQETRELFDYLTSHPVEALCVHANPLVGEPWVHPLYGPDVSEKRRYQGGMLLFPGADPKKDQPLVGFDVPWRGFNILVGIAKLEPALEDALVEEAAHIIPTKTMSFATLFEQELVYRILDPFEDYGFEEDLEAVWQPYGVDPDLFIESILDYSRGLIDAPRGHFVYSASLVDLEQSQAFDEAMCKAYEVIVELLPEYLKAPDQVSLSWLRGVLWSDPEESAAHREDLKAGPVALLLLDRTVLDGLNVDRLTPIGEVLEGARKAVQRSGDEGVFGVVEAAWKQYVQEQRWGRIRGISEEGKFGKGSTRGEIVSYTFDLMHPDFRRLPLKSLGLERGVLSRIVKGFGQVGFEEAFETIGVFDREEHFFGALPGVGSVTVDRLRTALLELSFSWRWDAAGVDRRAYRGRPVNDEAREELMAGLEELRSFFE